MSATTPQRRGRSGLVVLVVVAVVVVTAAIAGVSNSNGRAFDPDGVGPTGIKGLREVLERAGADVSVTDRRLDQSTATALLVQSDVSDSRIEELDRWVRAGHTLVITDAYLLERGLGSTSLPGTGRWAYGGDGLVTRARCDIDALAGLQQLRVGDGPLLPDGFGEHTCFSGAGSGSFVATVAAGRGTIVVLASPAVFTNQYLDAEDNAGLAVSLLTPVVGTRTAIVEAAPDEVGPPTTGPDAVLERAWSTPAKVLLAQAMVAFALYAWWRGRRVGRPVREPLPVQIAGSELTEAVGQLLARTHRPDRAATLLRRDLRRELALRLGLPVEVPIDLLANATAERTGTALRPDQIAAILTDTPVSSDQELLHLAGDIDRLREEALHGPAPRVPSRT